MSLAIHPYISAASRSGSNISKQIYDYVNKHEGVVHWNGEQILDWYHGQAAGAKK